MQTPSDYVILLSEIADCATLTQLKILRLGTVARRSALTAPFRVGVETAMNAREQFLSAIEQTASDWTLYIIAHNGQDIGVGTRAEVDDLVAEGTIPPDVVLTPCSAGLLVAAQAA